MLLRLTRVGLIIALAASGLAGTGVARATGTDCTNTATDGLEFRSPYLPREVEAQLAATYDLRGQPTDAQYHYLAYVPAGLPEGPVPLVMTMHGLFGSAKQHVVQTHWTDIADREGFILIAPNGHRSWDFSAGSLDIAYLRDVVADARTRNCLDGARLYATGHSMGGFMTHRLTCDAGDLFAAGASYAAGDVTMGGSCTPGVDAEGAPVPGWERMSLGNWHGTADSVVGYGAGRRGMDKWLIRSDCDSTPATVTHQFGSAETWDRCTDGVVHHFRTLDGHGHAWPDGCGGAQSTGGSVECTPAEGTGPWPEAADLAQELWDFLSIHERSTDAAMTAIGSGPRPERAPSEAIVTESADEGVTTGVDSVVAIRRTQPLRTRPLPVTAPPKGPPDHRLVTELELRVSYTGDGAGLGDSHPVCPTSNAGAGTQSLPGRNVTISAVDVEGTIVSADVMTEPFVSEAGDHLERIPFELIGRFDLDHTVLRADAPGDATKFWWSCGRPEIRYKETVGGTAEEDPDDQ